MTDVRRGLPGVDVALASHPFRALLARYPRTAIVDALRAVLSDLRAGSEQASWEPRDGERMMAFLSQRIGDRLGEQLSPSLRRVINATGVILHTNLGRAPLSEAARAAAMEAATGYTNLEYSLDRGRRGSRYDHCRAHLCAMTGAEDALVVNNAAAALILALNTLALARDVVVSRGELIEIGGGFRIPEIVERAGTRLLEVGTTNRTRLSDYATALERGDVRALLKVHRSNFRVTGFTEEVGVEAMVDLARGPGLPVIYDVGSGLMADLGGTGLPQEPTLAEAVASGAQVVVASGDKLLGGPQAGIILGSAGTLEALRKNPLTRALRVDKLILAALEATLLAYRLEREDEIPVLSMLRADPQSLLARAERLTSALAELGFDARVEDGASMVGGGTLPDAELPGPVVAVALEGVTASELTTELRKAPTPVIVRVRDQRCLIDPRTVLPDEERVLLSSFEHTRHMGANGRTPRV